MTEPREQLFAAARAAMLVFGVVLGLPGTIVALPEVAAEFGLSLADRGALISTLFAGMLAGCLAFGPVVDAIGQRTALAASTALVGLCLLLFAWAPGATAAAVALAALGVAASGMNIAANALSSDLFPTERAHRMNGIAIMAALGGLAMPATTAAASGLVSWRSVVIGAGAVALAVAVTAMRAPVVAARATAAHWAVALRSSARRPGFGWVGLLVLVGAGNEASMAGWTSTYLTFHGFGAGTATWVLASHWLGLIAGRLALSRRVERRKAAAIAGCALAGAAGVGVFAAAETPAVLAVAPFAIGLVIGIIVPTSLALGGERQGGSSGMLFGLLLTLAQVGGMTVPGLVGLVADRWTIGAGVSVLVATSLVIALAGWRVGSQGLSPGGQSG